MTLKEIVERLKLCKFKDEYEHPIENNVAFIELEKLASIEEVKVLKCDTELSKGQIDEIKRVMDQPSTWDIITTPMDIEDFTDSGENVENEFWSGSSTSILFGRRNESSEVKCLEIVFENLESIVIPIERVDKFEHGELKLFTQIVEDFNLDENIYITDFVNLRIKYDNESDLEYNPVDYEEPLGMFIGNPTSNNVIDRPNILGRILLVDDIVDIQLLDENNEEIKIIYVPWDGGEYKNELMSTNIENGILDIHIKK